MLLDETTHKQSIAVARVITTLFWFVMSLTAWCVLHTRTLDFVDHIIGALGSLALLAVMGCIVWMYRRSREKLLLALLVPPTFPILAYAYRAFL